MAKRVFLDHDSIADELFAALLSLGWDVVRSRDAGLERTPDEAVLRWAASEGRVVYTANTRDYARLGGEFSRSGTSHAGIICRTRQALPIAGQLAALRAMDARYSQEELVSQVLFLEGFL